jgi:diguanylate cyclase (GGDEF)-like protein
MRVTAHLMGGAADRRGVYTMEKPRFAGIGFAIIWLVTFVIFTFGSDFASGFALYALLAAYIGLKRSYLIRSDDALSVAGALTFGAALNFGPVCGGIVGVLSALALTTDGQTAVTARMRLTRSASGAIAGLAAGFAHAHVSVIAPTNFAIQSAAMTAAAIAFLAAMVAARLFAARCSHARALPMRLGACLPFTMELPLGMTLAAGVRLLYAVFGSQSILLVMPVVYIARQLLGELLPKEVRGNLANVYLSAMHALVAAIDARDRYTRMHTANVMSLALGIGRRMQLSEDEMEGLQVAALFHDVGKLWIPEHILLRPGKLDTEQFAKIQCHPGLGQRMLDNVNFPWSVGSIVRGHHERWDGTGYPDGLKGEAIPISARILCMADVFDAMTSKRLYRPSNTIQETLNYIRESSGTHFDPAVVQAFEQLIAEGALPDAYRAMIANSARCVSVSEVGEAHSADGIGGMSSEFVAVFEIAQTAGTSLDLEEVLRLLTSKVKSMISCATCVIFVRTQDGDRLEARIALGDNSRYYEGAYALLTRGQTGTVAQMGQGIIANYDSRDVTLPSLRHPGDAADDWINPRSVMIVPITAGEDVVGTINLYQGQQRAFSEEDLLLLTAVAPQVGAAIQNALLFQKTTETALTDVMTGLHNARYLFTYLDEQLKEAQRQDVPVSVLCMDVDNFKRVNDVLGHQQGDQVLREVGQLCLSQVRDSDLVCRYAGDEFIIVLPGLNRMEGLMTKRRIEVLVDNHKPYGSGENQVRIGMSIGVATFPDDGQDAHSLIACADANMYTAKRHRKGEAAAA